jgi:hypothetical protein
MNALNKLPDVTLTDHDKIIDREDIRSNYSTTFHSDEYYSTSSMLTIKNGEALYKFVFFPL